MRLPTYRMLSKEQDKVINIPTDESCLVSGPPGTGKTVVALYRANILNNKSEAVRLIMYNKLLSKYTKSATDEFAINSMVQTYHSWFWKTYRSMYNDNPPRIDDYIYDWDAILKTVNRYPQKKLDYHLILDEGQDMPNELYTFINFIAPKYSIFADENQQITETNSTLEEIRQYSGINRQNEYLLTKNYRNTREIAVVADHFYTGLETGRPELPDRKGEKPVLKGATDIDDTIEFIKRFARRNKDLEIGIFTRRIETQEIFCRKLRKDLKGLNVQKYYYRMDNKAVRRLGFDKPGIFVVNHPSTKGLEFDAVFIPELQEMAVDSDTNKLNMILYVMASRAREQLFFMYSGAGSPRILDLFPRDDIEWR